MRATLASAVSAQGVGLHSGEPARVELRPAPPGSGRRFQRMDLPGAPELPAQVSQVSSTFLCTTLGRAPLQVATVEHLMAALVAHQVDDIQVRLWGPELPIFDGSAQPWCQLLHQAGLSLSDTPARTLRVLQAVSYEQEGRTLRFLPADSFQVQASIHFDHPLLGLQQGELTVSTERFQDLAFARTFGFHDELQALLASGRAQGGSLDNALVFTADGVMNEGGQRCADEPLRHKLLDLIGDLGLLDMRLQARVEAHRPGHGLTHQALLCLLATPQAWVVE